MTLPALPLLLAAGQFLWPSEPAKDKDYYVAFRGEFHLAKDAEVEIRMLGAAWFVASLDGDDLAEGPARFPIGSETVRVEDRFERVINPL